MSVLPLILADAAPTTAYVCVAAGGYEVGTGRAVPTIAALLGLAGVVIGGLALARAARADTGNTRAVTALVLGLVGMVLGGLHWANVAGGLGTGNGLAGAVAADALGLVGMVLGGLALARSRRAG